MLLLSIPFKPNIPRPNGCSLEIAPLPINVVHTGMIFTLTNSRSFSDASPRIISPPISINEF